MKKVIVKTQDLKKYYQTENQTVRALDGVNFEVAEREFVDWWIRYAQQWKCYC